MRSSAVVIIALYLAAAATTAAAATSKTKTRTTTTAAAKVSTAGPSTAGGTNAQTTKAASTGTTKAAATGTTKAASTGTKAASNASTTKAASTGTKAAGNGTTKAASTSAPTTKAASNAPTTKAASTSAPTTAASDATTKASAATTKASAATTKAPSTNATSKATTKAPAVPAKVKIAGALTMTVADPAAFMNDTVAQDGVREGIASAHSVAGLTVSMNNVVLTVTLVRRRLIGTASRAEVEARRLGAHATKSVKVAYEITVPKPSAALEALMTAKAKDVTVAQLTTAIVEKVKAKGGTYATMDIKVTGKETPKVTQIAAPTTTAKVEDKETASRASAHVLASVVLGLVATVPFL